MKTILSMIVAFIAMIAPNTAFAQQPDSLKTATIKVDGITCNGDMPVIKKKLVNGDGIEDVSFTEAKNGSVTFTVSYHSSAISEKEILMLIEAAPSCDNPTLYPYKTKPLDEDKKRKK